MNGTQEMDKKWIDRAAGRIAKTDPKWQLKGFFNSLIISKASTTAWQYLCHVDSFTSDLYCDPSEITMDDYINFLVGLKGKSDTVQINAYHSLQKYSRYLKARGINDDYMLYVERPKRHETEEQAEKRERSVLTKDETKEVINAVGKEKRKRHQDPLWDLRNQVIVKLFLNTGIRSAALLKLDVEDIDLVNKTVKVMEKGSKSRKIAISDEMAKDLTEWMEKRKLILQDEKQPALFITLKHNRLDHPQCYRIIKEAGETAGIDRAISPHKFRATYGTEVYKASKDVYFAQKCMGHSSPQTTELYIRGQKDGMSARAADVMKSFIL